MNQPIYAHFADGGGFYIWDFSRIKLFCSKCGTNFCGGDVAFNYDIEKYQFIGNDPLFLAANIFWFKRFSSEQEFFDQMASYDISEKTASHALKELISKRIVEKRGEIFYLQEELRNYE